MLVSGSPSPSPSTAAVPVSPLAVVIPFSAFSSTLPHYSAAPGSVALPGPRLISGGYPYGGRDAPDEDPRGGSLGLRPYDTAGLHADGGRERAVLRPPYPRRTYPGLHRQPRGPAPVCPGRGVLPRLGS